MARPSSVRTGMFWRFGSVEDSRPVAATVWLNVVWIRPSAAIVLIRPSTVDAQLGLLTVPEHDHRQFVVGLGRQPGQRVGVRGVAGLRLLRLGQAQLAEEDFLELLGRAEVELVPGRRVRLLHGLLHRARELLLHGLQVGPVGRDAVPLHPGQQRGGGQLHVAQQLGRADLRQPALERLAEVEDRAGLRPSARRPRPARPRRRRAGRRPPRRGPAHGPGTPGTARPARRSGGPA